MPRKQAAESEDSFSEEEAPRRFMAHREGGAEYTA